MSLLTSRLYAIHHTILVIIISCKGQGAPTTATRIEIFIVVVAMYNSYTDVVLYLSRD